MSKTADYTLVNGVITHQKTANIKNVILRSMTLLSVNVLLSNRTLFDICCFWCV